MSENNLLVVDKIGSHTGKLSRQIGEEVDAVGIFLQVISKHPLHIGATNHTTRTGVFFITNIKVTLIEIGVLVITLAKGEPVLGITVEEEFNPIHSAEHRRDVVTFITHTI